MSVWEKWLKEPYFDAATRAEVKALLDKPEELEDRFYRNLEFGTGGLRGILGAGTNRMNKYVVRQATQGLATYIASFGEKAKARGVAIAHDSRHYSREFTLEAALILAKNGIKAYVFDDLRPTPELSFAVRHLGAMAGIVVTASHNPPQYNGYKVYWEDGGQIPPERAAAVLDCIEGIEDITQITPMELHQAQDLGLYQELGEAVDQEYIQRIKGLVINPSKLAQLAGDCKILYTPLHGTGNKPVRRALAELGFTQVQVVAEQEQPDPNFSTVPSPNPEDARAFTLALELAKEAQPDLILGTDPDADRIGVVVKDHRGEYKLLTGNQTGVLLTYYILSQLQAQNRLPQNGVVVKTIVTTDMVLAIANDFGISVDQTLTGFKFIGEKIHEYETTGDKTYLFGFEESYGYLAGTFVRDKDAVCAAVLAAEACAYFKAQGQTLYEVLQELWDKYGCYQESLHTIVLEGKAGKEETDLLMNAIRQQPFTEFGGYKVSHVEDYLTGTGQELATGGKYQLTLPKANVLRFLLDGGGYVVFRPSGTEPKAKIYISLLGKSVAQAKESLAALEQQIMQRVDQILAK